MQPKDLLIAKMFASRPQAQSVPQASLDASETEGPVKGPGTGDSDSIPATVSDENGQQTPSALSKDEFVVRADIIRKLGNGNADLGSKVLQNILDTIMAKSEAKPQLNQAPKGIQSLLGAGR